MLVPICIFYWQTQCGCYPSNELDNRVLLVLPNSVSMFHFLIQLLYFLLPGQTDNRYVWQHVKGKLSKMLFNVKGFWWWYIIIVTNILDTVHHIWPKIPQAGSASICRWNGEGENLLLLHVTQRWSQSLQTKQNLGNVYKLAMSQIISER
jgi:hypothetical protein